MPHHSVVDAGRALLGHPAARAMGRPAARAARRGARPWAAAGAGGRLSRGATEASQPALSSAAATQLALKGGEATVPAGAHIGQPGDGRLEAVGLDPVADLSPVAITDQQAGGNQRADVLDDGLAGDLVVAGQFGGGQRPVAGQLVEEATAGGVAQGGEHRVGDGSPRLSGRQARRGRRPGTTAPRCGRPTRSTDPRPRRRPTRKPNPIPDRPGAR